MSDLFDPIPFPLPPRVPLRALFGKPAERAAFVKDRMAVPLAVGINHAALSLLRLLPGSMVARIGDFYGRVVFRRLRVSRKIVPRLMATLQLFDSGKTRTSLDAADLTGSLAEKIGIWFSGQGQIAAELAVTPKLVARCLAASDTSEIDRLLQSKQPLIFVSAHIANSEVVQTAIAGHGGLCERAGARCVAPHNPRPHRLSHKLLRSIHKRNGRLAFPSGTVSARRMRRIVTERQGHLVFMLDERLAIPGFGRQPPRQSNVSVAARLAILARATIVPVCVERADFGSYRLRVGQLIDASMTEPSRAATDDLIARIAAEVEAMIFDNLLSWRNLWRFAVPQNAKGHRASEDNFAGAIYALLADKDYRAM